MDTKSWYSELVKETNDLCEKLNLDDFQTSSVRYLVYNTAMKNFKLGHKEAYHLYKKPHATKNTTL